MVLLTVLAVFGALLFVPRTPTSIASGLVFGLWSAPAVLVGATFGGAVMFWAVRHGFEAKARAWIARRPQLALIARAIDRDHWRLLVLLRFWGPVPASIQNCVFALTEISMARFVVISAVLSAPQAFAYAYIGSLGQEIVRSGMPSVVTLTSALMAGACIITAGALVSARIRSELARAPEAGGG
jgi:uncharacterized membrane protein YdjX (TVP38/TMEM64 family)